MPGGDVWDQELGGVRLLDDMCADCIFRPGNPMHLEPGRVKSMVDDARRNEGYVICHRTLIYAGYHCRGESLCRGFYDRYETRFTQVMTRLRAMRLVRPPTRERMPDARDRHGRDGGRL